MGSYGTLVIKTNFRRQRPGLQPRFWLIRNTRPLSFIGLDGCGPLITSKCSIKNYYRPKSINNWIHPLIASNMNAVTSRLWTLSQNNKYKFRIVRHVPEIVESDFEMFLNRPFQYAETIKNMFFILSNSFIRNLKA